MQVVVEVVRSREVTLHRGGVVNLVHQLRGHWGVLRHLVAHATVLAVAINPSVWHDDKTVVIVILHGLHLHGVILAEVAARDGHHLLRTCVRRDLVRFRHADGWVEIGFGHTDGCFHIRALRLLVGPVVGVGRGTLTGGLERFRLLADSTRILRQIVSLLVVLPYLVPSRLPRC